MSNNSASALAHPNIALIKYWGNCNEQLRIPANGSISFNLDGLETCTTVRFDPALSADSLILSGKTSRGPALRRVANFLNTVRHMAGLNVYAEVISENNFPMGTGIASSASAFAALSLAASKAAGLQLSERQLSQLARTGSGSACRSVPGGYVEWEVEDCAESSTARSIAPPEHWDLVDCIAIVSQEHKPTGSTQGHSLAHTSPLQAARVADAPRRLQLCRNAILQRDFQALASIVELDSNLMHAVMMTSQPSLLYWMPPTLEILACIAEWRKQGLPVCYTIDAGPNVHVLTLAAQASPVAELLADIPGVTRVLTASPAGAARILESC